MRLDVSNPQWVRVGGLKELVAANASQLRDEVRMAITPECKGVDVDLSETTLLDSSGMGALIAIHKTLRGQGAALRIVKPTPGVLQILELTRLHRLFEIVN